MSVKNDRWIKKMAREHDRINPLADSQACHAARTGVGGLRHAGNLEHDAAAGAGLF